MSTTTVDHEAVVILFRAYSTVISMNPSTYDVLVASHRVLHLFERCQDLIAMFSLIYSLDSV
jgi:hypothetical protein